MEGFIWKLYKSRVYTIVNELHWFWCSNHATTGSLTLHIQWEYNIEMLWRKAGESHLCLLSPVDCGWEFDTTRHHYASVRCLNHPAPADVMNLLRFGCKCGCKGTGSQNNNIPSTEVCGCVNFSCNNQTNSDDLVMADIDRMNELMMKMCIYVDVFLS